MVYNYKCTRKICENLEVMVERQLKVADYDTPQACEHCGYIMKKVLTPFGKHFSWSEWSVDLEAGRKR